jgi:signal transduction histidine kinase
MTQQSSVTQAVRSQGAVARLSLEHKLPLIIGALLLVVILALSAAAYTEARNTSRRVASERLSSVTAQMRDLLRQQAIQIRANAASDSIKPDLVAFAQTRDARLRARALAALKYSGPQPQQVVASELRDSSGAVLLSNSRDTFALQQVPAAETQPRRTLVDSAVLGRFRAVRDTIVYPIAVPVPGARGTYVVHWRRMATSRASREQTTRLIGSDATLFVGNADGSLWGDLERPVTGPPVTLRGGPGFTTTTTYTRGDDQSTHMAAAATVPGTPWAVVTDFPMQHVMAPVEQYMRRLAVIAALVLLLGLLVAWIVSRRITGPLQQLTSAADGIAAGDYSQRVRIARSDELGRLGRAFGVMASEVQLLREDLEKKVDERTRDLNATLNQLHDAQDALVRKEKLAMLGQLSSGVGHELRNPLGVMTNAVYYLKAVLTSAPTNVHEYLEILQQQITLSEKIVSDLLDFARSKPPQRKATSVAEVTQAQIARLGGTNGVKIEDGLPSDLPPVLVDPVQLGQIILNLLTNAVQAVGKTGAIRIRADSAAGRVAYEVHDSGPGIPHENLEKVFEPLFTTKARGIGLGLAVSRTLARANNGELTASSVPGEGARFRLTLQTAPPGIG